MGTRVLTVMWVLLLLGWIGSEPAPAQVSTGERQARSGAGGGAGAGSSPGAGGSHGRMAVPDRVPRPRCPEPRRPRRERGRARFRKWYRRRRKRRRLSWAKWWAAGAGRSAPRPGLRAWRQWVARELTRGGLPEARLEQRLHQLVALLGAQPSASIPQACGDWPATKGAYRFFDNNRVAHGAIMASHRDACQERMQEAGMVLVLQDTTTLDYTAHPDTEDLGPLDHPQRRGLFVHSALVTNLAGVPLGLLDQQVWTRDPKTVGKSKQRKQLPITEKESFKWLRGLRASLEEQPDEVCLITVADREADIFDFFQDAAEHGTQVLVRGSWNRRLDTPQPDYVWDAVGRTPVQGRYTVAVGRGRERPPREATVTVRFAPVTLAPPRHRRGEAGLTPLDLYAIEVQEETPPADGSEPLQWLLVTNRPVESFAQARECARWYSLRWLVERFHYVLKSGCRIEERQLGTAARLQRCLGVYALVAWRLLWLTYQARVTPEAPCTIALEKSEWQALSRLWPFRLRNMPVVVSAPKEAAELGTGRGRRGTWCNSLRPTNGGVLRLRHR